MMDPLVSIVLPTYNRAHLIGETIESIIHQSYTKWELLIVDDGSTDHTHHVVESYHDPRIRVFKQNHIGKLGVVRNTGLRHANGTFIAFADSDDVWKVHKLERQLEMLEKYPAAEFIFSNFNEFGTGASQPPDRGFFVGRLFEDILLKGKFGVCMPSLLFKSIVLNTTGLMNETYFSGSDIDFFYRLCYHFTGIFDNERLVHIRKHTQSSSHGFGDVVFHEHISMLETFCQNSWISRSHKNKITQQLYYSMGLLQSRQGKTTMARISFHNALAVNPFWWKPWLRWLQTWVPV